MAITGIQSITYGAKDPEAVIEFHKEFGLNLLVENKEGADFDIADGSLIKVRNENDPSLPEDVLKEPSVREVIWRVDSQNALDSIEKELAKDREVTKDDEGILHTVDDCDIPIGFQVFQARAIEFENIPCNTPTEIQRWNTCRKWYKKANPKLIHHIGYAVEPEDVQKLTDFYSERLNFRLTDISKGLATFLMADGRNDHHSIFIINSNVMGGGKLWNHVSYGVENIDELMTGANHLQRKGYTSFLGLARHRISSAINFYANNPGGGDSEYLTDIDYIDENWKPRLWNPAFGAFYWTHELCHFNQNEVPWDCEIIEGKPPKFMDTITAMPGQQR